MCWTSRTVIACAIFVLHTVSAPRAEPLTDLSGIDHIAVNVIDIDRSIKWYADVFGFKILRRWKTTVMVGRGNMKIGLFQRSKAEVVNDIDNKVAITHVAFLVDGDKFDSALEQVKIMGIPIEGPDDSGIATSFFFRDPDGHQLEVTSYYGARPAK